MKRRDLLWLISLAPLLARAQPARVRHIGFLAFRSRPASLDTDSTYGAFVREMRRLGYAEGKNLRIDWRFAESRTERLSALAAELVGLKPEVIVTHTTPAAQAAQEATRAIPIVAAVGDPLISGLVKSLARPGGNLTGISLVALDATTKQVELLKSTLPQLSRLGLLFNPTAPLNRTTVKSVEEAGKAMGITTLPVGATKPDEIESGFDRFSRQGAQAVIIANDGFLNGRREQLADLALKHRLPSISPYSDHAAAGGFMSYGERLADLYSKLAVYTDKILKGAKPGEVPFEQVARLELVLNLKTAKRLGIKVPPSILQRVDRVIE